VANDVVPGPITLKVGVTDAKQAEIEATVAAVYGGASSISMTTGGYIFSDGTLPPYDANGDNALSVSEMESYVLHRENCCFLTVHGSIKSGRYCTSEIGS